MGRSLVICETRVSTCTAGGVDSLPLKGSRLGATVMGGRLGKRRRQLTVFILDTDTMMGFDWPIPREVHESGGK
jgi:hypothetical protein